MTHPLKETNTDPNTDQDLRLSVQIALTGLSFLQTDLDGKMVDLAETYFEQAMTPEDLLFELAVVLDQPDWNRAYSKIDVVYATDTATTIPGSLFDPDRVSEYLKFNTRILSNDFIDHDRLDHLDLVVVYVPFVNINNYLFERFGSFDYFHAYTLLLKQVQQMAGHSKQPMAYVHILPDLFQCILMDQGKLVLINQFRYRTPEDFIYYLLFCLEQHDMDPNGVTTTLMGQIDLQSPLYEIAYRYVRNVRLLEASNKELEGVAPQQYVLLKQL